MSIPCRLLQGSTSALTDQAEVVTDNYVYNAWGKLLQQSGTSTNPFQWIGELGYHYDRQLDRHLLRRRQYQADMARFLSEDPLGFSAGDENLYRYVANNPVNRTDPSGESSWGCRAADWLLGTDDICSAFSSLGDVLGLIIDNLTSGTLNALKKFLSGAYSGLSQYLSNIGQHLKGALASWLGLPEQLFSFNFLNAKFSDYTGLIVKTLGYAWEDLADLARDTLGNRFVSLLISIFSELAEISENGVGDWVQSKVTQASELVQEVAGSVKSIAKSIFESGVTTVLVSGVKAGLRKLISLFVPGGAIVQVVNTLYQAIMWLRQNAQKLRQLLSAITNAIRSAFQGVSIPSIAKRIEGALGGMTLTLVTLLAALLGVNNLPDKVRAAIKKLRSLAQRPVKAVLNWVGKKLASAWDSLLSVFGLRGVSAIVKPTRWGAEDKNRLWTEDRGTAMVALGENKQPARQYLQSLGDQACSAEGGTILDQLESRATQTAQRARTKPQTRANARQLRQDRTDIQDLQRRLADKLGSCGGGCSLDGNCFVAGTLVQTPDGAVPIQDLTVGQRVLTCTAEEREQITGSTEEPEQPDLRNLWQISLRLEQPSGQAVDVTLLRTADWVEEQRVAADGELFLDLPELGARGWAKVQDLSPALISPVSGSGNGVGSGPIVTGTFRHQTGQVLEVWLSDGEEPVGVTARHPFWSVDRNAWVPAGGGTSVGPIGGNPGGKDRRSTACGTGVQC